MAIGSLLLGCLTYLIVKPLLDAAFVPVHAWTAAREGAGLYDPPYDWHLLLPAYATYAEPVIGSFLICATVSRQLPAAPLRAWLTFSLIVFAMRGVFFGCFTDIPVAHLPPVMAITSEGQFAVENATLATIVAATWLLVGRRSGPGRETGLPA